MLDLQKYIISKNNLKIPSEIGDSRMSRETCMIISAI